MRTPSAHVEHIEADEIDFPPEYRNYLVYCDESAIDGQAYYGWGTLWIPAEARGRLSGLLGALKKQHGFEGEVKWNKVKRRSEPFYRDLVEAFFSRNWIMFHAMLVRKDTVPVKWFDGGIAEARLHHLGLLLRNKVGFFARDCPDKAYHVRVDPLPSSYRKEDEKLHKITNAQLNQSLGQKSIHSLRTVDSKWSAGVQLADFLVGAVVAPWNQGFEPGGPKERVSQYVLDHLGWSDHFADTYPKVWKFNLWHLWDEAQGPRPVRTRRVVWRLPTAAYRRG